MNNLQLLTTEELENTRGGVGLAEIVAISGVETFSYPSLMQDINSELTWPDVINIEKRVGQKSVIR